MNDFWKAVIFILLLGPVVCFVKFLEILPGRKNSLVLKPSVRRSVIRLAILSHQLGLNDGPVTTIAPGLDESTLLALLACDDLKLEMLADYQSKCTSLKKLLKILQLNAHHDMFAYSVDDYLLTLDEFTRFLAQPPNETCALGDLESVCEKSGFQSSGTKCRIGIVVVAIHGDEKVKAASISNKQAYAEKHGYGLHVLQNRSSLLTRENAWLKIPFILSIMAEYNYDFIWSLDLDTVILDMDFALKDLVDPHYNLLIGVDLNGINTGSFLIKNSHWSLLFLFMVWKKIDVPFADVWWEQASIMHLAGNTFISNHIKRMPQTVFNSYENDFRGKQDKLPFVIHFAGDERKWEKVLGYTELITSLPMT